MEEYGTIQHCVLDDDYLYFNPLDSVTIVAALYRAGFQCRYSPALVNLAYGNGGKLTESRGRYVLEAAEAATSARRNRTLP